MRPNRSLDLTTGPILKKLILFTLPILATNLLQQFYNAADQIVVGQFAENGKAALAAIGTTGSAVNLIVNLFVGLAVGANIVCANLKGAKKTEQLRQCMHTGLLLAVFLGLAVCGIGLIIARPLMRMMNCPEDILDMAVLYIRIIFLGKPFVLIYNFAAGMLRAHGDTRRPMVILSATGVINVTLNLIFVTVFHMSVAGVAIATIVAQMVSCAWALWILFDPNDEYKLQLSELKLHGHGVKTILRVGIPCGINSSVFSFSNASVQAAMNTFSSAAVAGSTAATSLITITYQVLAAFYAGCVSFAGQCYGASKYDRIRRLARTALTIAIGAMTVMATAFTLFYAPAISLFNNDPEVIATGKIKLIMVSWSYLPYAVSEVLLGCLRGMKRSSIPTALKIFCMCAIRVAWVQLIFPLRHTLEWLCVSYPVSYLFGAAGMGIYYLYTIRKLRASQIEPALG